jgi:hypothetical protein
MLSLIAAFWAATQPAPPPPPNVGALGRSAWVFATVEHSEWCPAGNVRLDLRTGNYAFTAGAPRRICQQAGLERPVATGRLEAHRLAALRAAAARVLTEGFVDPACRDGGRPHTIVVDNGGTPVLLLTNGAGTAAAPDNLSCWSEAANALHASLEETFSPPHRR